MLCLDWHCAGECIATGSLDSFVRTFALEKSLTVDVLRGHRGGINCVQFLSNGHLLLSASSDRRVLLWDVRSVGSFFSWTFKVGLPREERRSDLKVTKRLLWERPSLQAVSPLLPAILTEWY